MIITIQSYVFGLTPLKIMQPNLNIFCQIESKARCINGDLRTKRASRKYLLTPWLPLRHLQTAWVLLEHSGMFQVPDWHSYCLQVPERRSGDLEVFSGSPFSSEASMSFEGKGKGSPKQSMHVVLCVWMMSPVVWKMSYWSVIIWLACDQWPVSGPPFSPFPLLPKAVMGGGGGRGTWRFIIKHNI